MPKCNRCDYQNDDWKKFKPAFSVYHDVKCPECGTTNVDTTDLHNTMPNYGFGNNNTLNTKKNIVSDEVRDEFDNPELTFVKKFWGDGKREFNPKDETIANILHAYKKENKTCQCIAKNICKVDVLGDECKKFHSELRANTFTI